MHRAVLVGDRKGFLLKVAFFIILLTFVGLMYLESNLLVDAVYFGIVLVLFVKFLIVKLYH